MSVTDTCGHACAAHKPLMLTPQVPSKICMHATPTLRRRIEEPHAPTKRTAKSSTLLSRAKRVINTHAKRATKTTIGKDRTKTAGLEANEDHRKEVLQEEPQDVSTRCHGRNLGEWAMPPSAAEQH